MTTLRLPYIHEYCDRFGKVRRYFRRGDKRIRLPGQPGSREFMDAYQAAMDAGEPAKSAKHGPGTISDLVLRFWRSVEFARLEPSSQKTYRLVLEPILVQHGHRTASGMNREAARIIIEGIGVTRPAMANLTAAVLRRLMNFAIDIGMRTDNPLARLAEYRIGTHHTWTDDELATFEARWPLGTRQRLAYAALLYTGQRGGDVVSMLLADARRGSIPVVQEKNGAPLAIPIHPALARAIKAGPTRGIHLVGDAAGRKLNRGQLTHLIKSAVKAAGLPARCKAHGLRKAAMRRLAENSASTKEIAAVSGHATLKEVERYTKKADQAGLARSAMNRVPDEEVSG